MVVGEEGKRRERLALWFVGGGIAASEGAGHVAEEEGGGGAVVGGGVAGEVGLDHAHEVGGAVRGEAAVGLAAALGVALGLIAHLGESFCVGDVAFFAGELLHEFGPFDGGGLEEGFFLVVGDGGVLLAVVGHEVGGECAGVGFELFAGLASDACGECGDEGGVAGVHALHALGEREDEFESFADGEFVEVGVEEREREDFGESCALSVGDGDRAEGGVGDGGAAEEAEGADGDAERAGLLGGE